MSPSMKEFRHLPDVMCQCWMAPCAFPDSNTFFVLSLEPQGRNLMMVAGRPTEVLGVTKVCDNVPLVALKTRTAPSPQAAARYRPSGEKRMLKTSACKAEIDMLGTSFFFADGMA